MAFVDGSVPSLVNGVSQQAPWVRLSSQLESQDNFVSSLVDGLVVREGTEHVLTAYPASQLPSARPFYHLIDRDPTNRFLVEIRNGDLRVFDLIAKVERSVSFPDGKAYLSAPSPQDDFGAVSVADYTFVLNRGVTVTQPAPPPLGTRYGYVYVRQGAYSTRYAIYINGTLQAQHTTPSNSGIGTETIASALQSALSTALGSGWVVERLENVIRVRRTDNAAFSISTHDGVGGQYMKSWFERIQAFADLPPKCFNGAWVEVTGATSADYQSYYVRFDEAAGVWKETVRPDAAIGFDNATMPWELVRNPDNTFVFRKASWTQRTAGDTTSAPAPSFVGRKIGELFFWKGRLGILADDSVVLSAAGEATRFWPETVTAQLDTDPIDVSVGSTSVAQLARATPGENSLILWSAANRQFKLEAADGIATPGSVSVDQVGAFPCDTRVAPAPAGKGVFFAVQRGAYAGVREFLIDPSTGKYDALDTTIQVPTYLEGSLSALAPIANNNTIVALPREDGNHVYVHSFFWEGEQKLQSSWSRWVFPSDTVVWGAISLGDSVLFVFKRPEGLFLEEHRIGSGPLNYDLPWVPVLDRKVRVQGVYNPATNTTTWTLPYPAGSEPLYAVLPNSYGTAAGEAILLTTSPSSTIATAEGDYSEDAPTIGRLIAASAELSRITVTDRSASNQRGRVSLTAGRLQISSITLNTSKTGMLVVDVQPDAGYPPVSYTLTPRIIGAPGQPLGSVQVTNGRYRVGVAGHNEKVKIVLRNGNHLPCAILSFDWEGQFTKRPLRV